MPSSANISTRLVKGRFGERVVAGPNGENLIVPARGRIDFEGMTPITQFPTAEPPVTILRPTAVGILDSEGYLCTPNPTDTSLPGERMMLMQTPNDPDSTVQGWTWKGTPRFVNADGSRLAMTMGPFTFDLPPGDEPFDLTLVVQTPASQGVGKEQAVFLAAKAQAYAGSAADDAEAARKDADVSTAAAVAAAAGVEGARSDAETARVESDRAVGLIAAAESSAGAAAFSADRADKEAAGAKAAANTASTAAARSADESAAARTAAGTAVSASTEAVSTANSAKSVATSVATRANAGEFKGATGNTGPANKLTVGTVGSASTASATITGTAPNQTLNLQLPKGETGPAVALSIGTVASGASAAATVTGTGATQRLNLTLPKGDPGGLVAPVPALATDDANSFTTPGTFYQPGSTLALNWPTTGKGNVAVIGSPGSVQQEFTPLTTGASTSAQVIYRRTQLTATTWSAWRAYVSQRVDNAAGRAIYVWDPTAGRDQLIYGDTGARNIPIRRFASPYSLRVQRSGNSVEMNVKASNPLDTTGGVESQGFTLVAAGEIPAAFRPRFDVYGAGFGRIGANNRRQPIIWQLTSSGALTIERDETGLVDAATITSNASFYIQTSYLTDQPWPTTLPGTAA